MVRRSSVFIHFVLNSSIFFLGFLRHLNKAGAIIEATPTTLNRHFVDFCLSCTDLLPNQSSRNIVTVPLQYVVRSQTMKILEAINKDLQEELVDELGGF